MIKKIIAIGLFGLFASCLLLVGHLSNRRGNCPNLAGTTKHPVEQKWGIEIDGIRLSAAGYMLDFRYRVRDPNRAYPVFSRRTKPYLVDQVTGAKFMVPSSPKVGPLRQTTLKPEADRIYFVMFANPGKFIKRGSKVDVVIGDFVAKDLVVE